MNESLRLQAEAVDYRYDGTIPAVNDISLELNAGDRLALVGNNGSGKSTLAKLLAGLLVPTSGRILLNGQDIAQIPKGQLAHTIGFVFQNPDHQIFSASVRDEIAFGPQNLGLQGEALADRVDQTLLEFGLENFAERPPASLSYGLRRLVSVASIAAMRTPVVILDEPSLGLDWHSATSLLDQVLATGPQVIILISHDLQLVAQIADEIALLDDGRLLARDRTASILSEKTTLGQIDFEPPPLAQLTRELADFGLPADALDVKSFSRQILRLSERQQP